MSAGLGDVCDPLKRSRLMAVLRRRAMTCGALWARACGSISSVAIAVNRDAAEDGIPEVQSGEREVRGSDGVQGLACSGS